MKSSEAELCGSRNQNVPITREEGNLNNFQGSAYNSEDFQSINTLENSVKCGSTELGCENETAEDWTVLKLDAPALESTSIQFQNTIRTKGVEVQ